MLYKVQTWNDQTKSTHYHEVVDAIDAEDAEQYIKSLYPTEKILAIILYDR
jgi:hypothetical protein